MTQKKSAEYQIPLPKQMHKDEMQRVVERAAASCGMYISHIGSYTRVKYPNSVHWHFKRDKKEPGLIDATFWDVENRFWLVVRDREPAWVHAMVPAFLQAIEDALGEFRLTI